MQPSSRQQQEQKRSNPIRRMLSRVPKATWVVLALGVVYYGLIQCTPLRIHCPIRYVTGLQCPGCGVSRMILALVRLDFAAAFQYHPVLMSLLPIWGGSYLVYLLAKPSCLKQTGWLFRVIAYGSIAVLLLFGVVRNFL